MDGVSDCLCDAGYAGGFGCDPVIGGDWPPRIAPEKWRTVISEIIITDLNQSGKTVIRLQLDKLAEQTRSTNSLEKALQDQGLTKLPAGLYAFGFATKGGTYVYSVQELKA